ncbi:hypothetical protein MUO79_01740 [Candidatus Bathyarchaeota archaeon]|nr:hypothetical protein [Candidatus Bathyarchaeota archaeon]
MGLKPGVDVTIEIRGEEIVISKPRVEGSYTEYYTSTHSPKLKESIDVKKIKSENYCITLIGDCFDAAICF